MILDLNPLFQHALDLMENTRLNLFITGRAGTGKSTLLNYFKTKTPKNIAVLAPTGVAALNVQGQTIHSFFKFKPTVTLESIRKLGPGKDRDMYRNLDAIVIDEISMVRADLLDCVDRFLRFNGKNPQEPFGGLQMMFIGDLYQLPPVVTSQEKEAFQAHYKSPYFFSAHFFDTFRMEVIELDQIYRQKDVNFIHLLNAIRNQTFTEADIAKLNTRVKEDFEPPEDGYFVYLTPYTANAHALNEEKLEKLPGKLHQFQAVIEGDFKQDCFPTLPLLNIRPHSQVMMVNNDPRGRWVNGTMGKVISIEEENDKETVIVQLENGKKVGIVPNKWEISQFFLEDGQIKAKVVGAFTQYPLALAWALTIHKSQGKTFEKVVFDIGKGAFTPGQVYVALSRCTSLEGMVLKKPIQKHHMWVNTEIVRFLSRLASQNSEEKCPLETKVSRIEEAIKSSAPLTMVYHKADDQKVTITIIPLRLSPMTYQGETYLGIEGVFEDAQRRAFRVDRIIEVA
ncbi:MAG: ATP-dependent exoDNAse [Alphaproteobacteria bacterium]|jgi:ATP-dependent exoDNAse (exonuclease V) alpha subunit|nr:ATP-dependent exoDNAse [Alphaproteobacteria bacterium]